MAHFFGEMRGSKGIVTRLGSKNSGIHAHIRGWDLGVETFVEVNENTGEDTVFVYLTSGSTGNIQKKYIGSFTLKDLEYK